MKTMACTVTTPANAPTHSSIHTGQDSLQMLLNCLDRAFDDDATGGVFGYAMDSAGPSVINVNDPQDPRLTQNDGAFHLIIIDSGNVHGDEWKYIYHPLAGVGTMIIETGLRDLK